jgi:nicotinate phosphoribosyltransferase
MDARHCAGREMAEMMAYAASVGSARAGARSGRRLHRQCHARDRALFRTRRRLGTMPHALIGYAGSTLRAAEMFHETFPDEPMTVLVDYFGARFHDSLKSAGASPNWRRRGACRCASIRRAAATSKASIRAASYAVLDRICRKVDPRLSERGGTALPRRHRRLGRSDLASARRSTATASTR